MYKQIDIETGNMIIQNSLDTNLEYDVMYNDNTEEFEYVGFDGEVIFTKDKEIKSLKEFCKDVIKKFKDNTLCPYFGYVNQFIPSSKNPDDDLPAFLCQSCESPENPTIIAPFYRIICVPKGI